MGVTGLRSKGNDARSILSVGEDNAKSKSKHLSISKIF